MRYIRSIAVFMAILIVTLPICFSVSIVPSTVKSKDITDSGATVEWKTNVLASGRVEYGQDINNMNSVPETGETQTDHSVGITSLKSGTKYYYRAISEDSTGPASSDYYSFITKLSKPTGLKATETTSNSITISWNKLAGAVHYKVFMDSSYVDQTDETSYTFSSLSQSKDYSFEVSALDGSDLESARSDVLKASTVTEQIGITFLQVSDISTDSSIVTWKTSKQVACTLYYDQNTALSLQRQTAAGTDHSVSLTGLVSGSRYYYQVKCSDSESQRNYFETLAVEPVLSLSGIHTADITANSATISWQTNIEASGKVRFSTDDSFSQVISDNQKTTAHNFTLTSLNSGMTYYYKVESDGMTSTYSTFRTIDTGTVNGQGFLKLDKTPGLTNKSTINVSGTTKVGSRVYIFVNQDSRAQVMSKINGTKFSFSVHLDPNVIYNGKKGNNLVEVMSWDVNGNKATDSFQIVCDNSQPILILGNVPPSTRESKVLISGVTDLDASVEFFISERGQGKFQPDGNGSFKHYLELNTEGKYNFSAVATDPAGNTFSIRKSILLDRTAPSLEFESDFTKETHFKIFNIKGKTEPGAKVTVVNFGPFEGYCKDANLKTRYGGCKEFIRHGDKYEEFMSTIDPVSYGLGLEMETTADGNGEFSLTVGLVENEVNKDSVNNLLFNVTDSAGNPYSIEKNIKYKPGCADWSVQEGLVQSFPFNIYSREISQGSVTASSFFPITYTGTGTPKVTNIHIGKDTSNHGLLMADDDKMSELLDITPTGARASQYSPDTGELYVNVPIIIKRYNGKVDDLPDKLNAFMQVDITYSNSQGTATCSVYPVAVFDMQKPELITQWLSPEMINRTIKTLDEMINNTKQAVNFLRTASLYGLVACGAMIAYDYVKGFFSGANTVQATNQCTQAQEDMKNTYYVCDRILCPNVPPVCDDFKSKDNDYYKVDQNGQRIEDNDGKLTEAQYINQMKMNQEFYNGYQVYRQQNPGTKKTYQEYIKDNPDGFTDPLNSNTPARYNADIRGPDSWSTTMESDGTKEEIHIDYFRVKNRKIVDPMPPPVDGAGKIVVLQQTDITSKASTCKDGTLVVVSKKSDSSEGTFYFVGNKVDSLDVRCVEGQTPEELGPPDVNHLLGCYSEDCPQFDNTKCFGLDDISPAGGLFASARCVCLPGLMSHLENWLKIMEGAKDCLKQAQVGEVRGGYCERLLAQFVCDILIELFKLVLTFAQNQQVVGQKTFGQGGIGTDSVRDSLTNYKANSQQVTDSLSGRYGDIVKGKIGLSSDELVNKACVVAFTGDWSLLDSVLNNVVRTVEIDPTIWLEAESRSYGYDPFTGQMNIGYNIYIGIMPGGETTIKAWLECDQKFPGYQYCSSNAGTRPITGVPSHMSKDTAPFNQNLMFVDNNAKYWFNKAVLSVDYKVGGEDRHAELEKPIYKKGDISGECTFSMTAGGFSCQGITQLLPLGNVQLYSESQGSHLSPAVPRYRQGDPVTAAIKINNQFADPFYIIVKPDGDTPKEYRVEGSKDTHTITSTYTETTGSTNPVYMSENVYDLWLTTAGGSGAGATTGSVGQTLSLNKDLNVPPDIFSISRDSAVKSMSADIMVKLNDGTDAGPITCYINPDNEKYKQGVFVNGNFKSPTEMAGQTLIDYCNGYVSQHDYGTNCIDKTPTDFSTSTYNRVSGNYYSCIIPEDTFIDFKGADIKSITSVQFSNIEWATTNIQLKPTTFRVDFQGIPSASYTIDTSQSSSTATSSSSSRRTVTINVYKDTDNNGHGDTPIFYSGGTGDQTITFTYEYGGTNDNSRFDFIEPVGEYLNNDENKVPIGFNVWNPQQLFIAIQARNNQVKYDCLCKVDFSKGNDCVDTGKKTQTCNLAVSQKRTTLGQSKQPQFLEFLWDASSLDRQPTTMYDFFVYNKENAAFQDKVRRTFQFDKDGRLSQDALDICLGAGYCEGGFGEPVQSQLDTLLTTDTAAGPTVT